MHVNVVFVTSCLYSAVTLTLARESRFIRHLLILLWGVWGECMCLSVGRGGYNEYRGTVYEGAREGGGSQ